VNNTNRYEDQTIATEDYTKLVLEQSEISASSIKSIVNTINRLDTVNLDNIFTYKSLSDINEMCPRLNTLKRRSTEAFKPFISYSTKTLCHSMGDPLKLAEDVVEYENKNRNRIMNSLLKIVNLLSHRFALAASHAVLLGECLYSDLSSYVFDEQSSSTSYRKEIAHMARYYRLHLGSFLVNAFAKDYLHSISSKFNLFI
jgi:hypothetical protein